MKKQSLCAALCALLVLTLSACGGNTASSAAAVPSPAEALVDDTVVPTAQDLDTIKWLNNAYAPYTANQGTGDIISFGGGRRTVKYVDKVKSQLEKTWGVTDRDTADYAIKVLESGKTKKDFIRAHEQLVKAGFTDLSSTDFKERLRAEYNMDSQTVEAWLNSYQIYTEYGEDSIDAWNECLIIRLASECYVAGYYTYEEAVAIGVEKGKALQERYDSWDAMMQSNLLGYSFTLGHPLAEHLEDGTVYFPLYERLKKFDSNPFSLAWDTPLEVPKITS